MASDNQGSCEAIYESGAGIRNAVLERSRQMAALTKPWVLPPEGQNPSTDLPENYQSVGSRGVSALVGKMLIALWTPGTPWFQHKPTSKVLYDPRVPSQMKRELQTQMIMWDMTIVSELESHNLGRRRGIAPSFRSRKRATTDQLVVTGDSLERLHDDNRIQVYRRDQYCTWRDSAGEVLQHAIKETVDPRAMVYNATTGKIAGGTNAEFILHCGIDTGILEKPVDERMIDLYTLVEWQPITEKWVITQECNGVVFNVSEETVNPFFSTAFNLSPGEHYGRGLVEENSGDLRSLDELNQRLLELMGIVSKGLIVKDENSLMKDEDLEQPPGSVIHGRVRGGQVEDVALLSFEGVREYNMLTGAIEYKSADLGRAFLLESAVQPEGDRVTATQVRRIAAEIDSALGGSFAPIAEQQQLPLLARAAYLAKKKGILPNYPDKFVDVEALTGVAALNRDIQFAKGLELASIIAQFPEEAQRRINWSIFAQKLFELRAFYEPGIVKTDADIQKETQQAMQQAMAAKAGEQAIESTGKIAEQQAQPQSQGG